MSADLIAVDAQALLAILPRLSAMNSFVRSKSAHGWSGGPLAYVVYHYKGEALIRGTRLGIVSHRAASTPLIKCRDCGGTGRYVDSYGFEHPHCRRCFSKGYVTLEFVESTFSDSTSWLTPREKAWRFVPPGDLPPSTNTPQVQAVGNDLTPDQVAEHMCEIEAFFALSRPEIWHDSDGGRWDYFATYQLYVGETATCPLCSAAVDEANGHRHGLSTGRLAWTAVVCPTCKALHGDSIFEVLRPRLPASFLTPAVRRWVETHPVRPGRNQ